MYGTVPAYVNLLFSRCRVPFGFRKSRHIDAELINQPGSERGVLHVPLREPLELGLEFLCLVFGNVKSIDLVEQEPFRQFRASRLIRMTM